ncbi:CAP domain-containing protein [Micromonospora echinofusca]|uniref:SCP domain-containing protein n=1 Tax=Micromonospora echinofusca TaxID=47858 RepID=A0ABS3VPP3_MICEH|nr:CAP domain-containing protein [Micromonospora echinofusca]MBO4206358.1 hypothetical protein [Micromonospora echinofusca]
MHGWNDPLDQEGAPRPVPPTGEPPRRSSGQPSRTQPDWNDYQSYGSAAYASLPGPVDPYRTGPSADEHTDRYPAGSHRYESDGHPYVADGYRHRPDGYRYDSDGHHSVTEGDYRAVGAGDYRPGAASAYRSFPGGDGMAGDDRDTGDTGWAGYAASGTAGNAPGAAAGRRTAAGRRRDRRRFPRPVLAAGAVAVVALAVMAGAGVAFLPTGNEGRQSPVAEGADGFRADGGPAAAGAADTAGDPTGTPSATASPSASTSPTAKPSPTPVRSKAPTRSIKRTASPSPTRSKAPAGNTGTSSVEQQVVTLVNQERAKAGCGAVTINANLATAAQLHSDDQAARQQMSHTGSDGSDFVQRAKRAGYQYPIGENVAMGYETAAAVMDGWMNSPGHRANILNCDARAIGVGVATGGGRLYWTQVFGSRA